MLFGIDCLDMAAADSIRVIDDDYVKRVHSRNPSGHLHKGMVWHCTPKNVFVLLLNTLITCTCFKLHHKIVYPRPPLKNKIKSCSNEVHPLISP